MQRGLQKQQEEQLVPCGRGHCVLVSKLAIKLHLAIVSPIGVDAFECKNIHQPGIAISGPWTWGLHWVDVPFHGP